jgi:hypothetical protein
VRAEGIALNQPSRQDERLPVGDGSWRQIMENKHGEKSLKIKGFLGIIVRCTGKD